MKTFARVTLAVTVEMEIDQITDILDVRVVPVNSIQGAVTLKGKLDAHICETEVLHSELRDEHDNILVLF